MRRLTTENNSNLVKMSLSRLGPTFEDRIFCYQSMPSGVTVVLLEHPCYRFPFRDKNHGTIDVSYIWGTKVYDHRTSVQICFTIDLSGKMESWRQQYTHETKSVSDIVLIFVFRTWRLSGFRSFILKTPHLRLVGVNLFTLRDEVGVSK